MFFCSVCIFSRLLNIIYLQFTVSCRLCCIAPVLAARCIKGAHVTIGTDPDTAGAIEEMGAHHENCQITVSLISLTSLKYFQIV